MKIALPDPALVLLVGPSGGGKSTFARRHFGRTQVLASDELRAALADDANDQAASAEAFRVLSLLVEGRLRRRLLTVVDATNLRSSSRRRWLSLARRYGIPAIAVSFDFEAEVYLRLNAQRAGRQVEPDVVHGQAERMATARAALPAEGYAAIYVLRSIDELAAAEVELTPRR